MRILDIIFNDILALKLCSFDRLFRHMIWGTYFFISHFFEIFFRLKLWNSSKHQFAAKTEGAEVQDDHLKVTPYPRSLFVLQA